jgi:hypothetical protein
VSTTNYYPIYINSVLQLAATIVIKSADSATALNNYTSIVKQYPLDEVDPTTWKYYLNISGEYHPTDTQMTVVSLDTLQTIVFSKENLAIHLATAAAYAYGTYQYNQLVQRYPFQQMLILGILYPVNINTAIAADDGTILGYPPGLVEINEYSFISNLQNWITGYRNRWVNPQYGVTDTLYSATSLGIMYLLLVQAIISIRLRACKTHEAHSFHVRQYLASHGFLDQYIDNMTLAQQLFFYRNIAYIERNPGTQSTFDWLVENIMTVRNLPLAEFTMKHDLSQQPPNIYPTVTFVRSPVNSVNSPDSTLNNSLLEVLNMEALLAVNNNAYQPDYQPVIQTEMQDSLSNSLPTKVLISSTVDYTNNTPYTLPDILFNHWIWLAVNRNYLAYVTVTNPKTGETITLSALDSFTLLWYVYCTSIGVTLATVPQVVATRVQRLVAPTGSAVLSTPVSIDTIMSVVDPTLVDSSVATQALSMQPSIGLILSNQAFYNTCVSIYNAAQMQVELIANQQDSLRRAEVQNMVEQIYSDNVLTLAPTNQSYATWLSARNINLSGMDTNDLQTLYSDIIGQATGIALNPVTSLSTLQTAMIDLLAQLSSYSIQVVGAINTSAVQPVMFPTMRPSNIELEGSAYEHVDGLVVYPLDMSQEASQNFTYDINPPAAKNEIQFSAEQYFHLKIPGMLLQHSFTMTYPETIPMAIGYHNDLTLAQNTEGIVPVLGLEEYLKLTSEQRQNLHSIFDN